MNKKILIIAIVIILFVSGFFMMTNPVVSSQNSENSTIGSDARGSVIKEVYNSNGTSNTKIAVITGMHPRETLSINTVPTAVREYAIQNNIEIINYHINVTDQPQNFYTSRDNGEGLVEDYVVSDINHTDCQLVIIAHDHQKGYGNGTYIATPTQDDKSLSLGENVHKLLPSLNFYPGYSTTTKTINHADSVTNVDMPLAALGKAVFVYELPEWINQTEATNTTYNLLDVSFKSLQ
jgi:hypothetical protein